MKALPFLTAVLLIASHACTPARAGGPARRHVNRDVEAYARWLEQLARAHPDRDDRLLAWCRGRLGTPYVRDCQGEGDGQDPDPLFTPRAVDCTVFVLQAAASLDAKGPDDLIRRMLLANYRRSGAGGSVAYRDRYHYTVDRLLSSPLFRDVTRDVFQKNDLVQVKLVLNRKADGTETVPLGWSRPVDVVYRPSAGLTRDALSKLPPRCGVVFVRKANFPQGFIAGHEGIVVDRKLLFHASSAAGRVVVEPFLPYARRRDGIMIFEFVPVP